jgi:hypothetical protein
LAGVHLDEDDSAHDNSVMLQQNLVRRQRRRLSDMLLRASVRHPGIVIDGIHEHVAWHVAARSRVSTC